MFRIMPGLIGVMAALHTASSRAGMLERPLSASFGMRHDPIDGGWHFHRGIDVPAARGTPVLAAADGIVQRAGAYGGYGLMVEIAHSDGGRTRYAHLLALSVKVGDRVMVESIIGHVGSTGRSTGPHLHFEYWIAGRAVDPMPHLGAGPVLPDRSGKQQADTSSHVSAYAASRQKPPKDCEACANGEIPLGSGL